MLDNKVIFVDFANKKRYKRRKRMMMLFKSLKKRISKLFNTRKKCKYPKKITNIN